MEGVVRSFPAGFACLWLVGCGLGGQSGENNLGGLLCEGATMQAVAQDDAQLGFSADDVLAALPMPTGITWEHTENGVVDDALSLSDVRIGGQVQLVDYDSVTSECGFVGQQLRIPLLLDLAIGEDEVTVEDGRLDILAAGTDASQIYAIADWGLPAELSGSYGDALDAWWDDQIDRNDEWAEDFVLDGAWVTLIDPWDALSVDIEVQHESSEYQSATMLWRGLATFPAPPTPTE